MTSAIQSILLLACACAMLALQGCATYMVHQSIENAEETLPRHIEWWDDAQPRVIQLPQVCGGQAPVYRLPGPVPAAYLTLDEATGVAIFHDGPVSCSSPTQTGNPLRLIISAVPVPMLSAHSALLLGRLAREGDDADALLLDRADGGNSQRDCPSEVWCMHHGTQLHWNTGHGHVELEVRERLNPESAFFLRRPGALMHIGYVATIPIDIVLSPIELLGFGILAFALRDFNPWH